MLEPDDWFVDDDDCREGKMHEDEVGGTTVGRAPIDDETPPPVSAPLDPMMIEGDCKVFVVDGELVDIRKI